MSLIAHSEKMGSTLFLENGVSSIFGPITTLFNYLMNQK